MLNSIQSESSQLIDIPDLPRHFTSVTNTHENVPFPFSLLPSGHLGLVILPETLPSASALIDASHRIHLPDKPGLSEICT